MQKYQLTAKWANTPPAVSLEFQGEPKEEEEESQETDESAAEEAEDETAVEAVTWGFLKSRAMR